MLRRKFLNIITTSWPDWFGVSIFKSVNWEMRKRREEMAAPKSDRDRVEGRRGGKYVKKKRKRGV